MSDELIRQAGEAVDGIITQNTNDNAQQFGRATLEHIARLAWLDGYGAGHQEMKQFAISTLRGGGGDE